MNNDTAHQIESLPYSDYIKGIPEMARRVQKRTNAYRSLSMKAGKTTMKVFEQGRCMKRIFVIAFAVLLLAFISSCGGGFLKTTLAKAMVHN
jgi:hypothetical protein